MIRFEDVECRVRRSPCGLAPRSGDPEGEFFTLLGPSGCGKTTALRSTRRVRPSPTGGDPDRRARCHARSEREARRGHGVPELRAVPEHPNVRENIAFGLSSEGVEAATGALNRARWRGRIGLAGQFEERAHELSGGQQQRVALARALALSPRCCSSTSRWRTSTRAAGEMRSEIRESCSARSASTTVYVTHDQEEALALSDRIAVLDAGTLQQVGTPEEIYDRSGEADRLPVHRREQPSQPRRRSRARGGLDATAESLCAAREAAHRRRQARHPPSLEGHRRPRHHDALGDEQEDQRARVSCPASAPVEPGRRGARRRAIPAGSCSTRRRVDRNPAKPHRTPRSRRQRP